MRGSPQKRFTALTVQLDQNARVVLESGPGGVWAVAFHPDGKHFFEGTSEGIRRWQVEDRQEISKQTGSMDLYAISMSSDHKWVVCGTTQGASVWDAELREKVFEVEDGERVFAVDVAPDCTRFATGNGRSGKVSIWNITTAKRLVGPLGHGGDVERIMFSLDGGRLATACSFDSTIRIFDTHNGDQLISIENSMRSWLLPILWSRDSEQLFAISEGHKIKSFSPSTGSPLAEWQIHDSDGLMSIAQTANSLPPPPVVPSHFGTLQLTLNSELSRKIMRWNVLPCHPMVVISPLDLDTLRKPSSGISGVFFLRPTSQSM